jgi:TQXA domain-containing protein/LPXTG-motif cell wall-anchored protein
MASRLNAGRIGAAVLGASIALMASAIPASADVHAVPGGGDKFGPKVNLVGKKDATPTALIGLNVEGKDGKNAQAKTYCVELPQPVAGGARMVEVPWDKHPRTDSGFRENHEKVAWILSHSYPTVDADELDAGLRPEEAIAATQAAIWHFSDKADLNKDDALEGDDKKSEERVVKLYDHLVAEADKVTGVEQPKPTLTVDPASKAGKSGDLVGPFTITTTADKIGLVGKLPKGVQLTDKTGVALKTDGQDSYSVEGAATKTTEVFVKVPEGAEAGEAKFAVHAEATVQTGRLFIRSDENHKTQSLIVASPASISLDAQAVAKWTAPEAQTPPAGTTTETTSETAPSTTTSEAAPATTTTPAVAAASADTDKLAYTGASIFVPLIIGLVLVGGGAAALLVLRRRKNAA